MKISVIIPAYNSESSLTAAVRSLHETRYSDLEVLIVDDGSRDATRTVAQRLANESSGQIQVLTHPGGVNRGAAASRNLGVRVSTGELIAFLDADDVVYPHRFAGVSQLIQRPEIGGVYGYARVRCSDESQSAQWTEGSVFGTDQPLVGDELLAWSLDNGSPWPTTGILLRRSFLESLNGFDESLPTAEDSHLWWRMAWTGNVVPGDLTQPICEYRRHAGSLFAYGLETRLRYCEAMSRFRDWCAAQPANPERLAIVDRSLARQRERCLLAAREEHSRTAMIDMWSKSLAAQPRLCGSRRFWGHLVYGLLGR